MRILTASVALLGAMGCEPPIVAGPTPAPTVVAAFDPRAMPPVVPTPNNLAFRGGDGVHLNVPDQPTDSPEQRAINAFLRMLDGFPPNTPARAGFSGALAPASVRLPAPGQTPGSVLVFDVN